MSHSADRERLARLLGGEALRGLRDRLRLRYARGRVADLLILQGLAAHEREALTGLLGLRARNASSLRVRVSELDETLRRAGLAGSLRHALELLDGAIPDLQAERSERERRWQEAFAAATDPRLCALLSEGGGRALIKRLSQSRPERAPTLLTSAARVLERLPARGLPRSQLAADVLGDAHALDRGEPLATIILTVLRASDDERARHTWARAGVLVNEFAKPALILNLDADTDTPLGRLLATAREAGEPLHLSLRALLRAPPRYRVRGRVVFVCENANLLAIAADRLGSACAPLVCTDGMPSASPSTLLQQLREQGAELRYHGDFDWPGIAIGNFVMRRFGATPWRFGAADYVARPGRSLAGRPVEASWDAALAPAMVAGGHVLEEEAVADGLLDDLATRTPR